MKKELLPTHEECAEKIQQNEAKKLHVFIHDNEPAGIEESELFRTQLADLITEREISVSKNAWEAGITSFASECGNDMSEEIECEIPIYDNVEKFLDAEVR